MPDPPARPNVLLVTLDQFRADCIGAAGHPVVRTPTLDRLCDEGVRFSHHFANCAPCAPGRASLLTGLWQMNHRVTGNGAPLADDLPHLAVELRRLGYAPTLFGYTDTALDPRSLPPGDPRLSNWEEAAPGFDVELMLDESIAPWLEWLAARGEEVPPPGADPDDVYRPADVDVPADRGAGWRPARYAAGHTESAFVTEAALDWLDRRVDRGDAGPWCAHVSYLRPHPPYLAPAPYHDLYDPADVPAPYRLSTLDDEAAVHPFVAGALSVVPAPATELDQRQLRATYYGMITEVDHQLGVLLDGIDALGQLEDTVVVVTSDHGEQLGDHWLIEKLGFFDESYRIPLIVRWPGMTGPAGRVVDAFTESVDVLPTLVDLCGGSAPEFCDGASLRPFLDSDREGSSTPDGWRDAVHVEYDFRDPTSDLIEAVFGLRMDQCSLSVLRDRHGKYVHFAGLPPLFFDLDDDPHELRNVAAEPGAATDVLRYAQRLLSLRMAHTDPRLANHRATPGGPVHRIDPPRPASPARR
jgi:arylsulfatase A-like enzyme